jgi:hypothetical protein
VEGRKVACKAPQSENQDNPMKKFFRAFVALASFALTSALFADFTLDLGSISSTQTFILAVSSPTSATSTFELVDSNDQVIVSGTIEAVWNGSSYDYVTSATATVCGVSIIHSGFWNTDLEMTGLPTGNYRLKTYVPWGYASTSVDLYGPFIYGGQTNFGTEDRYYSDLVMFDLFIF